MKEDKMVAWYHQLDGYEFEQAPGVGDGQGSLVCCSPWVAKSWTRLSDSAEITVDFPSPVQFRSVQLLSRVRLFVTP